MLGYYTMVKTLIFDFAGVVATTRCYPTFAEKLSKKFGADKEILQERLYKNDRLYRVARISTKDFWTKTCKDLGIPYKGFVETFSSWYTLNSDLLALIKSLKKSCQIVLHSDNFDAVTPRIRKNKQLASLFEKMYFSNELRMDKTDLKTFEYIVGDLKRMPQECLFVDDKGENLEVARKIGIKTILFENTKGFKADLRILKII